jgi:hypothetical protein
VTKNRELERFVRGSNVRGWRRIPAKSGLLDDPGVDALWKTAERLGMDPFPLSPRRQFGEFVGGVVAVGSDDNGPIGEPSPQDAHHLTEQSGRCFVPLLAF